MQALELLNKLSIDAILFVVDEENKLIGSLTDGDIRRGLLKSINLENKIDEIIQKNPRYIKKGENDINKIIRYREENFRIIPVLDDYHRVVNVINFRNIKSYLPIDAVIMAGGKGQRLLPLTESTPKPMLKIGDKPIIEHNLDRLALFGIDDFWISINYLGEQIEEYFGDGSFKNISISYVKENIPLGTIGAVSQIKDFKHDYVLVTNSDLLTSIDYEHFFLDFLANEADMAVVTIPFNVNVPYAVLETNNGLVVDFKEKPTYTYNSNGGIYLIKRELFEYLPFGEFFNATDLIDILIKQSRRVCSYSMTDYWLDIGNPQDYQKAIQDIKHIKF
jgi:dTDP-glucose pyrophosphorylase/mRNA-degrading endonuclease RelE of RelBE toxin-antitoxin system